MPKIKVKLEVPDDYCDKPDNVCPMCVDDGVTSYCMLFNYALEEENYHCKRLRACKKAEVKEHDYVVNAGVSWDNLEPFYTSSSKKEAIDMAQHLPIECVEVVYSPCDNWNVDEIVWSNRKKGEVHFQKYETKPEE